MYGNRHLNPPLFLGVVQLVECGIWDAVAEGSSPFTQTEETLSNLVDDLEVNKGVLLQT